MNEERNRQARRDDVRFSFQAHKRQVGRRCFIAGADVHHGDQRALFRLDAGGALEKALVSQGAVIVEPGVAGKVRDHE